MPIPVLLIAPGLLAQPQQALANIASLAALAELASPVESKGIAAALVDALHLDATTPIAPLMAIGAGLDPENDYVIAADPVLLAADRGDIVLVQPIADLSEAEAGELLQLLNAHFAEDGVRFQAARPDAWFLRGARAADLSTTPTDVVQGRGILPFLPGGSDGRTWTSWQNEIQMLLHEHPVNASRETRGKPPVTGVWFWGGGRSGDVGRLPDILAFTGADHVGDVLRGMTRRTNAPCSALTADDTIHRVLARTASISGGVERQVVVALDAIDDEDALRAFDSRWLAPAMAMLSRHEIGRLQLVTDGNGAAVRWSASPASSWRRFLPRGRPKPFVAPGR
jgi:hypothetical protein